MDKIVNRFNLVDENWIPLEGQELISLGKVFSSTSKGNLGGSPLEKVALIKLFLAIAQSACTPKNNSAWKALGPKGLEQACQAYLNTWHHAFWLYGKQPFLQMPAIKKAKLQNFGSLQPHIATGNTTILQNLQQEHTQSDAQKALLVLTLTGYGLGGKKTDNSIVLTPGYTGKLNEKGKPATGRPGPWLGYLGYLHHFVLGQNLLETIWLNLLTQEDLDKLNFLSNGVGKPAWETNLAGEACPEALTLKDSLMGRLTPCSKFCLLSENAMHYTDGIAYPSHKDGWFDTSVAMRRDAKEVKALWADPNKLPWRNLPTLLAFLGEEQGMDCFGLQQSFEKLRSLEDDKNAGLWIGGLRVSSNAGEQYVSGTDDFVESLLFVSTKCIGSSFYMLLKSEMEGLVTLEKILYACTCAYAKDQKADVKIFTTKASNMFWGLCNTQAQSLIDLCGTDPDKLPDLREKFKRFAIQAYNFACPNSTAKQMTTWAEHRPNFAKYLSHQ